MRVFVTLPPALYFARTLRVRSFDRMDVDIDAGFGVHVHREIVVEGLPNSVPAPCYQSAFRALTVLVGGKRLVLSIANPSPEDRPVFARAFLNESIHGDAYLRDVPGCGFRLLYVADLFAALRDREYDIDYLKLILNGRCASVPA